ncbi:hypothetical protein H6F94_13935 [Leptolyngbya sp. FACHB-261]|nr:hypothetical protein [Leptolyngbya sp. FACHB-261]
MATGSSPQPRPWAAALSALALAVSLAIYQRSVLANPLSVAQGHWQAIATENTTDTLASYDSDAVLEWRQGSNPGRYSGGAISLAWQSFFADYQISGYQVVSQEAHERTVKATLLFTLQDIQGQSSVLPVTCTLQLDNNGRIQRETWSLIDRTQLPATGA